MFLAPSCDQNEKQHESWSSFFLVMHYDSFLQTEIYVPKKLKILWRRLSIRRLGNGLDSFYCDEFTAEFDDVPVFLICPL